MRSSPPTTPSGSLLYDGDKHKGMDACQDDGRSIPSSSSFVSMTKFLADQGRNHPIEALVSNRSWMVDERKSVGDRMDDDEFRNELERLNLSEAQVTREIRAAMKLFQEATGKNELSQMETSLVWTSYFDMLENATRDSSASLFPSDEACRSIPGTASDDDGKREPPEVMLHFAEQENRHAEVISMHSTDTTSGMHFESCEDPTAELVTVDDDGSLKPNSLDPRSTTSMNGDSHSPESLSAQWCANSAAGGTVGIHELEGQSHVDLVKESSDIFEEESFWDRGFWKSPTVGQISSNPTLLSRKIDDDDLGEHDEDPSDEFFDEYEASNHTRLAPECRKYGALEKIFLPLLRPSTETEMIGDTQTIRQPPSTSHGSSGVPMSTLKVDLESAQGDMLIEHQRFSNPEKRVSHRNRDSSQVFSRNPLGHSQLRIKHDRWCGRLWVLAVVFVHAAFFIACLVVLSQYLLSRQPVSNEKHAAPGNDACATSYLLPPSGDAILGTSVGATKDYIACEDDELVGTWYTTVGTGRQMVASCVADDSLRPKILILSGPCSNLKCESFSWGSSKNDGTGSVVWLSQAGELYHIFVHSQPTGTISLSLTETPLTNADCQSSSTVILPLQKDELVVSSLTIPFISMDPCHPAQVVGSGSWFSVPGTGKIITASLCNSSLSTNNKMQLTLFSGSCDDPDCFLAENSWSGIEMSQTVVWLSDLEEMYFLFVSNSENIELEFSVCFSQAESGESCQRAINVSSLSHINGHVQTSGIIEAHKNNGIVGENSELFACNGNPMPTSTKWYRLKGNGDTVTATTCGSASSNLTAVFDVFSGSACTNLRCEQSGIAGSCGASGQQFLSWVTVEGAQYWIAVYGDDPLKAGSFALDLMYARQQHGGGTRHLTLQHTKESMRKSLADLIASAVCSLFSQRAWRWRRLKKKRSVEPQRHMYK
jgi:hypothetical protein